MPRVSKFRSPAQKTQTRSLHVPRAAQRQEFVIAEGERAQIFQLRDQAKNLQQELRNERKRSKRAKTARLRDIQRSEDKENQVLHDL